MDKELEKLVSEFQLDYRKQIYMRLFGDYWVVLRGKGNNVELWSQERKEWQTGDALQDKFLFKSYDSAWEHYKANIRKTN